MKFSKYNNPNKRRAYKNTHSRAYIEARRTEMHELLSNCNSEAEKEAIITAYNITVNS